MLQSDQSCSQCGYWQKIEDGGEKQEPPPPARGHCRRFPPQHVVLFDLEMIPMLDKNTQRLVQQPVFKNTVRGQFPVMNGESIGCGEFERVPPQYDDSDFDDDIERGVSH